MTSSVPEKAKRRKRRGVRLGIVGLQGAGKTTYLTVLYELLRSGKRRLGVVTVRNPDQQDYLERMWDAIRSGDRVPKNDPSLPIERIAFEIISGHRRIDVSTFDYAGENTQARRQQELRAELQRVDGILLFLPPSAVRGGDEEAETNKAVQKLFGDLAALKRRIHAVDVIAVVVTKADDLKRSGACEAGDIESVVERGYAKHLLQLRARTRKCKVFVSSALGDAFEFTDPPTAPDLPLDEYGVYDSFSWLLETASRMRTRRAVRHNVSALLLVLAAFALAATAYSWHGSTLFHRVQALAAVPEDLVRESPTKVLRRAGECAVAIGRYRSWHTLWPRRNRAVEAMARDNEEQCAIARQALQRSLAEVDDTASLQDAFREAHPLLEWCPEQAAVFHEWYDDIKLRADVGSLLGELAASPEDSIPSIKAKIGRVHGFMTRHAGAVRNRTLVAEVHRLDAALARLTAATDFGALLTEIERQKSPMQRYQICSGAVGDDRWTTEQRAQLETMVAALRSDAAESEWTEIMAFDRDWSWKYSDRIVRREDFQKKFPDIARLKKCAGGINSLLFAWDRWEYENIRTTHEQNPVGAVGAVEKLCRGYRDSGRSKKEFLAIVENYLRWYEGLKTRGTYRVNVSQLKVTGSAFTDGKAGGRDVQVYVAVKNQRESSVRKKTNREGIAYDLGSLTLPWKMNDNITIEVSCFNLGNETVKEVFKGQATLAYLAGKRCASLPEGVQLWFTLQTENAWFDFPAAEKVQGE
jgi:hypothetical protein